MSVNPGVGFAAVLNAILLFAALGVLAFLYWKARPIRVDNRPQTWYVEAMALAREVQRTADVSNTRDDHDRIQRQLVPLANRLKGHSRSAPKEVDEQIVRQLHDLGVDCYMVGMEHSAIKAAQTGVFLEEKLDDIRESAEGITATVSAYL